MCWLCNYRTRQFAEEDARAALTGNEGRKSAEDDAMPSAPGLREPALAAPEKARSDDWFRGSTRRGGSESP